MCVRLESLLVTVCVRLESLLVTVCVYGLSVVPFIQKIHANINNNPIISHGVENLNSYVLQEIGVEKHDGDVGF